MKYNELQHLDPAWRKKADYVIGAKITDPVWSKTYQYEQLAAAEQQDGTYMICCIPFALYDLCLGDYVTIDDEANVVQVVRESDYVGFRVATNPKAGQMELLHRISRVPHEIEIYSSALVALAADNAIDGKKLASILQELEDTQIITAYETIDS